MPTFLDLFAGAGGLSEGFIQAGFTPVAHVEMDLAACFTLKTRAAFHWLEENNNYKLYYQYLYQKITRDEFYKNIPKPILDTVLNFEISEKTIPEIFKNIDFLLKGRKLDLIIGGPPCQAYSLAGRARSKNNMKGDKRNYLYRYYAEFLNYYQPKFFVFENVLGLLSAKEENNTLHFDNMLNLFKECGYSAEYKILNAYDYGILQNRKRIIIIGKKGHHKKFYPQIDKIKNKYIVWDVLEDLPKIKAGEGTISPVCTNKCNNNYLSKARIKMIEKEPVTFHQARPNTDNDLKIYKIVVNSWNKFHTRISYADLPENLKTHKNITSFVDRFKIVAGEMPYCQTIVAHISRDGHYYIHPDINQNRSLTPREAARLQTFPDNYYFESKKGKPSRTIAYKQIGNAVPVLLAYKIAKTLKKEFE